MRPTKKPALCTVAGCGAGASYAFLAITGEQRDRVVDEQGNRVRACQPHLMGVVGRLQAAMQALPGGGPARLRAVPLTVG